MSKYLDEVGVKYMWDKTKAYVDEGINAVKSSMTSIYTFKGTVDDLEALKGLSEESLKVGDVYNVKASGMNYAWTGEKENPDYDDGWDPLGGMIEIPTLTVEDIDKIISGGSL